MESFHYSLGLRVVAPFIRPIDISAYFSNLSLTRLKVPCLRVPHLDLYSRPIRAQKSLNPWGEVQLIAGNRCLRLLETMDLSLLMLLSLMPFSILSAIIGEHSFLLRDGAWLLVHLTHLRRGL